MAASDTAMSKAPPAVQLSPFLMSQVNRRLSPEGVCTTPWSSTWGFSTVTVQEVALDGSATAVAVMLASPLRWAVMLPSASTEATAGLELVQVRLRSVTLQGCTAARRSLSSPGIRVSPVSSSCTPAISSAGAGHWTAAPFSGRVRQDRCRYSVDVNVICEME